MTTRTKLLGMCDVIMRVPPLFIIDEILKISSTAFSATMAMSSPSDPDNFVNASTQPLVGPSDSMYADEDDELRLYNVAANSLKFLACSFGECFSRRISRNYFLLLIFPFCPPSVLTNPLHPIEP